MKEPGIRPILRLAIFAALVVAVVLTVWLKGRGGEDPSRITSPEVNGASIQQPSQDATGTKAKADTVMAKGDQDPDGKPALALPRLIDLGRGTCIPCKMMMPVLEELEMSMKGRMIVQYIDIGKDPEAAARYEVKIIPTQIFIDPDGTELYRHTGFIPREDILARWKVLGFDFTEPDPVIIDDGGQD